MQQFLFNIIICKFIVQYIREIEMPYISVLSSLIRTKLSKIFTANVFKVENYREVDRAPVTKSAYIYLYTILIL